ncbi:MAG: hypothetical protein ACREKE_07575, partial [bacterium]
MTKPRPETGQAPATQVSSRLVWVGFGLGAVFFLAGLGFLLAGRIAPGLALSIVGIFVAALAYLLPAVPWEVLRAIRAKSKTVSVPDRVAIGGSHPRAFAGVLSWLPSLARFSADRFAAVFGADDTWRWNRLFLLAPALLLLAWSALLSLSSTIEAVAVFVTACIVLWVYFQDMARPLIFPKVRQNIRALVAQVPSMPFQVWGIWLLDTRFANPAMVWWGFFICFAASCWNYYALTRWPLDLREGDVDPILGWSLPRPFFTSKRLTLLTGFAAAAAVAGCLAEFVFPGDYQMLAVASAFVAMLLLVLSFPWLHNGLAFSERLSPAWAAPLGLLAALLAFALGAHGQDLVEKSLISKGLWFFLAGGIVLVLGLSRFAADPVRESEGDRPFWTRLEVVAVLLLGIVAFGFHIWHVGTFPFAVEGDEGGGGCWATWVLKGTVENHFINQNYPLAFFSVTALFFKIAGITIATLRW